MESPMKNTYLWLVFLMGILMVLGPKAALAQPSGAKNASPAGTASVAAAQVPENAAGTGSDYQKLKSDYDALKLNYDNAVAQAKALLVYKNQSRNIEAATSQFDTERQQLLKDKKDAQAKLTELEEKIKPLEAQIVKITQERDDIKKSFEKASVVNIIGEDQGKKTAGLEKERKELQENVSDLERKAKLKEHEAQKKDAQLDLQKRQIDDMKAKYEEAKKKNRGLENKLEDMPRRMAELARENKILVKSTALMHYNLGVFYTQNKDFNRAIPEFEKAVELNPDDSASYFNLGYIYAEHLENRAKAITYFRQFLKLTKKDDKDADWVKRYILTWQTWEGKEPIT